MAGVCVVMLGAGCAREPSEWRHPSLPEDEWADSAATCRHWAEAEVDKGFRDGPVIARPDDRYGAGSTLARNVARYEAARDVRALFARCMRHKGFVPVDND